MQEQLKAHHILVVNPSYVNGGLLIENRKRWYFLLDAPFKHLVYGRNRNYHCYTSYTFLSPNVLVHYKPENYSKKPSKWLRDGP